MEVGKGGSEETHLGGRMSEIDGARATGGVGAGEHEFARDRKCVFVGAFKHEGAGVGHERSVKAGGNVAIHGDAGETREAVDEFGGGHDGGIDPVDVGEVAAGGVMIDVDEEAIFETLKQGALNAIAFQQYDGIVYGDGIGVNDAIGKGKGVVDTRDAIVHDDLGLFAHEAKDLAEGECGADAVSVGAGVRGHHEPASRSNLL